MTAEPTLARELSTFAISWLQSKHDSSPRRDQLRWDELVTALSTPRRTPCYVANCKHNECEYKNGRSWSPATFPPGAARKKALVESISFLVVDLDHLDDAKLASSTERLAPYRHILHSSHSDRAEDRCLRAVVAQSRSVTAEEWSRYWPAAMTMLGQPADPSCCDANRLYYLPSRPRDASYYFFVGDGEPLDVAAILAAAPQVASTTGAQLSLDDAGAVGPGQRHAMLKSLAGGMRHRGAGYVEIYAAAAQANQLRCNPPKPDDEVKAIAEWAAAQPITTLLNKGKPTTRIPDDRDLDDVPHAADCEPPEPVVIDGENRRHARGTEPPSPNDKPPAWEWAPPLEDFLGDEEPSDDDSEDWTIRDLIPRGENFLFAAPWKAGKTWMAIAICCCIALGRSFLGFANELGRPGRVLLIALEDGKRRMRKRVWQVLRGMGLTPNDPIVRAHLRVWDKPIRIPGDKKALDRFKAEMQRWKPDVILIDSLTRAMTGSQNDIKDATAFTTAWRELGVDIGAAIGFLHHTNKVKSDAADGGSDPFNAIRGSGELLAAPRNLIVMDRIGPEDSKVSAVSIRGNLDLRRSSFAVEWTSETRADGRIAVVMADRGEPDAVKAEFATAKKQARQDKRQQAADRNTRTALTIARDRGAVSAATLAVILGVAERTAALYLKDLRERGLLGETSNEGSPITPVGLAWLAQEGAS